MPRNFGFNFRYWTQVPGQRNELPRLAAAQTRKGTQGHWSVTVSGNWRLTFAFEGEDAILVDYQDYH